MRSCGQSVRRSAPKTVSVFGKTMDIRPGERWNARALTAVTELPRVTRSAGTVHELRAELVQHGYGPITAVVIMGMWPMQSAAAGETTMHIITTAATTTANRHGVPVLTSHRFVHDISDIYMVTAASTRMSTRDCFDQLGETLVGGAVGVRLLLLLELELGLGPHSPRHRVDAIFLETMAMTARSRSLRESENENLATPSIQLQIRLQ